MKPDGLPILWQYTFSNYNEKVRWTLDYKRTPHVRRNVLPGTPRALWFSRGDGTLPVLDLDGERIVDSTRIIAALEQRDPDLPLYPTDPEERRRALELEQFFDEQAGHEMRRALFYELRDEPEYLGALVTSGRGALARRYMRAGGRIGMLGGHPAVEWIADMYRRHRGVSAEIAR
jgi:glutathione S-transferase